ncbi:MAG: hypothetical protein ABI383_11390 [Acidobacteriaceae bacterium]
MKMQTKMNRIFLVLAAILISAGLAFAQSGAPANPPASNPQAGQSAPANPNPNASPNTAEPANPNENGPTTPNGTPVVPTHTMAYSWWWIVLGVVVIILIVRYIAKGRGASAPPADRTRK